MTDLVERLKAHDLKTWPGPFAAVRAGLKPWELRKNDRDYQVGDLLRLREWSPPAINAHDLAGNAAGYTGEIEERIVTWMLEGPAFGLPEGYVIMSLQPSPAPVERARYDMPIDVGLAACEFPVGANFGFHDDPGEHDPCYVILPGGAMIAFNHDVRPGVDVARARFVQAACNRALLGLPPAPVGEWREAVARIIDPEAFYTVAMWREKRKTDPAFRGLLVKATFDMMAPRRIEALAKADQISALGREGEQGTSVAENTDAPRFAAAEATPCKSDVKHADDCQSHIVDVRGRPDDCTCGAATEAQGDLKGGGA